MATLSSFVTGQSIAASIEKTYIKAPDSLFSSLWVASGAGIAVSTETGAANLPEGSNKATALKILRASGSDYVRYRFKLDAADGGKVFKLFWNQIYSGSAGDYTITMLAYSDAAYTLNQASLTLETSSVPSGTTSFYTTVTMPAYSVTPYIELRINGLTGTTPLYLSGIIVGPGNLMQGAVITDWQTYTTTLSAGFGGGTATGLRFKRQGSDMHISGTFQCGTVAGSVATISLPSGTTIDFTKVTSSSRGKLGRFEIMSSSGGGLISSTDREGVLFSDGTSATLIYFAVQSGVAAFTQNQGPQLATSNSYFTIDARIPIAEWAGSGVTTIGPSAQVEYVFNTDITATGSPGGNGGLASSASGSTGVLISANWATGTNYIRRCNFQYPLQNDDVLVLEVADSSSSPLVWVSIEERLCARLSTSSTFSYGAYIAGVNGSTTAIDVVFLNGGYQPSATFGTAAGTAWSALSGFYWRVRKAKAVVPVGIPAASSSGGGGGSGFIISTKTSSFTAATLNHYLVDTSSGVVTATLPAGSASATVKFSDDNRTWATQFFTIQPATGEKIDGLGINENLVCDVNGSVVQLNWDGGKWVLDTNAVGAGVVVQTSSAVQEKNYISRPDNADSNWTSSNVALVSVGTENSVANLPENSTKTSAIRVTRISGTTGYAYIRMVLDTVDGSKKFKIQWNQKYAGAAGDYTLQLFSFTASDYSTGSAQISAAVSSIPSGNTTFVTTFDTPASTAPYLELRIVAAAGTTPLYLSGVLLGPGIVSQGAVISEWQSYTPVITNLTLNATAKTDPAGRWRRVGDSMEVELNWINGNAGAASGSVLAIGLPTGYTVDDTKLSNAVANLPIVGVAETSNISSAGQYDRLWSICYYQPGAQVRVIKGGSGSFVNGTDFIANAQFQARFTVPIAQWAGSGTVNISTGALVEYAWNATTTVANDIAAPTFGYGPAGGAMPNGIATAAFLKRVRFQYPIQTDDIFIIEVSNAGGPWTEISTAQYRNGLQPFQYQGAATYGIGFDVVSVVTSTDIDISFGQYAYASGSTYGAAGTNWSAFTAQRWRVRKAKASAPVGIAAATQNSLGLITLSQIPAASTGSGSGEKNYVSTGTDDSTNWTASGAGIAVSTETSAANLPENATKTKALKVLRASGSDYARFRFTLDAADYNKKLKLYWNQKYAGTAGDYAVSAFSNTASDYTGTSTQLTLSTNSIPALDGSNIITFDSSGSSAPYIELRINGIAGTTPLYLSGILVGPGTVTQGAAISEWQSFTPVVAGFGTNPTLTGFYQRVGSSMVMRVRVAVTNVTGATTFSVNLPVGLNIDSSRMPPASLFNTATYTNASTGASYTGSCYPIGTNQLNFYGGGGVAGWNATVPVAISTSHVLTLDITVPIAEWAGSGTVNLGAGAQVDFQSNFGTTTAAGGSDTTSFLAGSFGAPFNAFNNTTAASSSTKLRCRFSTPIQATDTILLEVFDGFSWAVVGDDGFLVISLTNVNGAVYGMGWTPVNATDVDVIFGNAGRQFSPAGYGAINSSAVWANIAANPSTYRWRIKKFAASAPVGFGLADATNSGLLSATAQTIAGPKTFTSEMILGPTGSSSSTLFHRINIPSVTSYNFSTSQTYGLLACFSANSGLGVLGNTSTSNTTGLSLDAATHDTNSAPDLIFRVRENDNSDFATLTAKAFAWHRFTTEISSVTRAGAWIFGPAAFAGTHNFNGTIVATGDVTAFSDARLKSDIMTISNALSQVENIRGVSYTKENGQRGIGFVAQEIMEILPEVVRENIDGYLSVAYGNVTALLVEAVKELSKEVKVLRKKLDEAS